MTFRYVPHRIAPHPPSGGDSHDSGIVQSGSPHSTRITNGSRLNTATAMAVRPTTLEAAGAAAGGQAAGARVWRFHHPGSLHGKHDIRAGSHSRGGYQAHSFGTAVVAKVGKKDASPPGRKKVFAQDQYPKNIWQQVLSTAHS